MLQVCEIFYSIMGESTRAGLPGVFVRLSGCNLHCTYCDTRYACEEPGRERPVADVVDEAAGYPARLVCITGGEPLLQPDTPALADAFLRAGWTVVIETNGSLDIDRLPAGTHRVMDLKTPDSGMADRMDMRNLARLNADDEIKIVCCSHADYEWARDIVRGADLPSICPVLLSPAFGRLEPRDLAAWMLEDGLAVRLQLQLHRILWPDRDRGV